MTNQSPHPNSLSPQSKHPQSAFQWPIPPLSQPNSSPEISVREILDRYSDDPELLKYILTAKSEEDKKKAARDTLKAEEARIQLRQMDLEIAREQSKSRTATTAQPPPPPTLVYGLAPVQQQVLARFNYPQHLTQQQQQQQQQQQRQSEQQQYHQQHRPPPSPGIPYPHSAHPLFPPSSSTDYRVQSSEEKSSLKRNRSSISNETEQVSDKLSHDKVMEALKAKIQRSSNNPQSPLSASKDTKKKKQPPRPIMKVDLANRSPSSNSPRSAKPVLPPIDTNLGRLSQPARTEESSSNNNATNSSADSSDKLSPVHYRRSRSLTPST
ncbi:hypothetical protein RMCBS344292_00237 [Rhizopus microsporus]|nr:hypothetical protein RMCBS344292_00237 [Rhizopus microsporus]